MNTPIEPTRSLLEHNAQQCAEITDPDRGAFSEKNMYFAWKFYGKSPSRTEAISYWILEARCGERYRDEHPGPVDTEIVAPRATA